ncbi:Hypothetical protein NTJ_03508 [Nesidiocoris tenuis]|uniref:VTT domain-containing protein n=1 Tax=Nesidiocoris tenuis TaxID=355587 RepID=A0ABN7AEJ9_9HEMI|nr:Hypothetical protein NTJ_03508 [Nesidiocoris tenuis]
MQNPLGFIVVFVLAISLLFLVFRSAPEVDGFDGIKMGFPVDMSGVKFYAEVLSKYYESQPAYTILLFSAIYLFKQSFCIPGSALLNILAGALFGVKLGVFLCTILTGAGATCAYILSHFYLEGTVMKFFGGRIHKLKELVDRNQGELLYFLVTIRVFPITPNWLINLASPIVGIPLPSFIISVVLGLFPYNLICVNGGSVLAEITNFNEVYNARIALNLGLLATCGYLTRLVSQRIFGKSS